MRSGRGGIYLAVSSTVASLSGLRVSAVDIKKQVKEGEKGKGGEEEEEGWGRDGGRVLRQRPWPRWRDLKEKQWPSDWPCSEPSPPQAAHFLSPFTKTTFCQMQTPMR